MLRKYFPGPLFFLLIALVFTTTAGAQTPGSLEIVDKQGQIVAACPLKHTAVKAEISGFVSRVTVTQQFENTQSNPIEAVYVFPLPQHAAVFEMNLKVGAREVRGVIRRREEAERIYQQAIDAGHTAALLNQERPNIFTQTVGNIPPGEKVSVTISYFEVLQYEDGVYEFVFPMVVGPRYIPGAPVGRTGGGRSPDTTRVPDASRITPPVAVGTRAGHDISLEIALDAGVPLSSVESRTHQVQVDRNGGSAANIRLMNQREIPNRDFILRYDASGAQIQEALLTHREGNGPGYFALILQPPDRVRAEEVTPREIVFVLDTSGSMHGFPIEKAKKVMDLALTNLNPQDTFNLITFAGDTHVLFPEPVYPTAENLAKARAFLASRSGGGGTEMMKAIRAALDPSDSQRHMRVVCFMTDGYVGNDMEIIGEVKRHPNARVFSFGIGSSVNRFLLDGMAYAGRGEVEYVGLTDDGDAAARRFYERVRMPLLMDVSLSWNGVVVNEVQPGTHPDLFAAKPLVITGRYPTSGRGEVTLRGMRAGQPWTRTIPVHFPAEAKRHEAIGKLWARAKITQLMMQDMAGLQSGGMKPEVREQITLVALEHELMSQFTSFVAVEMQTKVVGGRPQRIEVPVELPHGVSPLAVGEQDVRMAKMQMNAYSASYGRAGGRVAQESLAMRSPVAPPPPSSGPVDALKMKDESRRDAAGRALAAKATSQLLSLYDCGGTTGLAGCGKQPACSVQVSVTVKAFSPSAVASFAAAAKKLGGVVLRHDGAQVELVIATTKLDDLAALDAVTAIKLGMERVTPQMMQQACGK